MSFDTFAPHYRWMEWVLAGGKLQRCRTACLKAVPKAENILLLGEGNGRFLAVCREQFPAAHITCVDSSLGMIHQARKRLQRAGVSLHQTSFEHADILTWKSSLPGAYDLVVTNFFLDCFPTKQLEQIIQKVASITTAKANWLLADFQAAEAGLKKLRSKLILWIMYRFFRTFTKLPARKLIQPDPFLQAAGFGLVQGVQSEWGLLRSDWWQRTSTITPQPES